MKFDFCIGNPPYQEETKDTSDKPVYNEFMDAAYKIADKVELITPARFLFNAGKTPKSWNEKMLKDKHFKVSYYEQDSAKIFANTDIKGGVTITYRDKNKEFGSIDVFSPFEDLRNISQNMKKFLAKGNLSNIMFLQNKFNLEILYKDYPEFRQIISSDGKEKRIVSSSFEKLTIFHEQKQNSDDICILGVINSNSRQYRWVNKKYIEDNGNLYKYKVLVPKSNGSGAIGEVLSTPLIGEPLIGYTQSFIGIGAFDTKKEAEAALKYIKTRFARTMLGILKITQDNPPEKWCYVPLENFINTSEINWNKSISEIDEKLYKKYEITPEQIHFIKQNVKEMT